ncbi:MAG: M50 family metallopeptidase [Planctomycetes bacterium]|nr:M50 family metallopeptidase [Planctomycetota bacterium]
MFDPDDLDTVTSCYHEAGHVLMAHLLGGRVVEASIEHDGDGFAGSTSVEWTGLDAGEHARRSAMVALAGPVAEAHWRGAARQLDALTTWRADWQEVERALATVPPAEREGALRQWLATVRSELTGATAWEHLCRLADMLEAHGTLDQTLIEATLT